MDKNNPKTREEREKIIKKSIAFVSLSGEKFTPVGRTKEIIDEYIEGKISYEQMGEMVLEYHKKKAKRNG